MKCPKCNKEMEKGIINSYTLDTDGGNPYDSAFTVVVGLKGYYCDTHGDALNTVLTTNLQDIVALSSIIASVTSLSAQQKPRRIVRQEILKLKQVAEVSGCIAIEVKDRDYVGK